MSTANRQQTTLKEATELLESGVKSVFTSERYLEYLSFISKFHNYSYNNCILIMMQNPQASLVAGFNDWKNKHNRYVKKDEKGIKIIAPTPFKTTVKGPVLDTNNQPVMIDGKPLTEDKVVQKLSFRVVSVFDVSQTDGEPLPSLAPELTAQVDNFEDLFTAICATTDYTVKFADIPGGAKGYCRYSDRSITIQEGMSEAQTIKTLIHEVAHSRLHEPDKRDNSTPLPTRSSKEVEAESVAFIVANKLGVDTSDYSFDYIANWSTDKEMSELKQSLEVIQSEASAMIDTIEKKYAEILRTKETVIETSFDTPSVEVSSDMDSGASMSYIDKIEAIRSQIKEKELQLEEVEHQMDEHYKIYGYVYPTTFPAYDRLNKEINELKVRISTLVASDKEQPSFSDIDIASKVREIPIVDYAARMGFTVQKVGTYYTLKEHDSVRIDPRTNRFFRNSTGDKGSIIDFVMEFENVDNKTAISQLARYLGTDRPVTTRSQSSKPKEKASELVLPEKSKSMRNIFAYLIQTRKISPEIVNEWVSKKNLYQDTHNNCVFVTYDNKGNPAFVSQRGTNTSKPFKADVSGSNYDVCHFINNGASKLIVCEGVIDLMSVQTILKAHGRDLSSYNYLSLNGSTKVNAIINALQSSQTDMVILATDNDTAGRLARDTLRDLISEYDSGIKVEDYVPPHEKDWNAELVSTILAEEQKKTPEKTSLSDKISSGQSRASTQVSDIQNHIPKKSKNEPNL